jgi:hypothetical protein
VSDAFDVAAVEQGVIVEALNRRRFDDNALAGFRAAMRCLAEVLAAVAAEYEDIRSVVSGRIECGLDWNLHFSPSEYAVHELTGDLLVYAEDCFSLWQKPGWDPDAEPEPDDDSTLNLWDASTARALYESCAAATDLLEPDGYHEHRPDCRKRGKALVAEWEQTGRQKLAFLVKQWRKERA